MRYRFTKNPLCHFMAVLILSLNGGAVVALPITGSSETGQSQNLEMTLDQIQAEGLRRALSVDRELSLKVTVISRQNKLRRAALDEAYKKQIVELKGIIETADKQTLAAKLGEIEATVSDIQALHQQKWQQLKALLTEKQLARYLLYQDALQRELQRRAISGMAKEPGKQ